MSIDALLLILFALVALVVAAFPRYRHPRVLRGVLSPDECDHIVRKASSKLKPSTVSETHKLDSSVRDSQTAWLGRGDAVVDRVTRRLLKYTDRPIANCEKLQVVKYSQGGFYKPHQDAFKESNKRVHTFVACLEDGFDGGETVFPNLGKQFKLTKGDVLFFDCLDNYGMIPSGALHGGLPVKRGTKIIANLWVRKRAYRPKP